MIKISANVAKKVPIDPNDFTSQQFGASMEIEVSDSESVDGIRDRIRRLHELLAGCVDEQINAAKDAYRGTPPTHKARLGEPQPAFHDPVGSGNGNGNGNGGTHTNGHGGHGSNGNGGRRRPTATDAQVRAVYGICKDLGLSVAEVCAKFNVAIPEELHVKDASHLIDSLKARRNGAASRQ